MTELPKGAVWVRLPRFIGDGIMALFGSPEPLENPEASAVLAAKNMLSRLEVLNQSLILDGIDPLKIGIGINSGDAIIGTILRNPDGTAPLETFLAYAGNTHLNKWNELFLRISPALDFTLYMGMLALPCVLAGIVFLVVKFGAVALWIIFGLLLVAAIMLTMSGKG